MTDESDKVSVQIRFKGLEKTIDGSVEETWALLSKFYSEFIPSFEIADKLRLSIDLQKLAKDCEGLIAFSKEGANILIAKTKLTDNEALALWLLAGYLGYKLGMVGSDSLSKESLQIKLGKSSKITSTRLGELIKTDWIAKTEDEKFRMTTFGIIQMQREALPRIISKTGI